MMIAPQKYKIKHKTPPYFTRLADRNGREDVPSWVYSGTPKIAIIKARTAPTAKPRSPGRKKIGG
jgi:hypothetical protein